MLGGDCGAEWVGSGGVSWLVGCVGVFVGGGGLEGVRGGTYGLRTFLWVLRVVGGGVRGCGRGVGLGEDRARTLRLRHGFFFWRLDSALWGSCWCGLWNVSSWGLLICLEGIFDDNAVLF